LTYSDWVQAGVGGDAKVISKSSAETAITKLMNAGRVQKVEKLYSCKPQEEAIDDV